MAGGTNLKTNVTADTSDFNRKMRQSQTAIKDFKRLGEKSLASIEGLLGGTSGQLGKLGGNIRQATGLFRTMGASGASSMGALAKGVASVGGAIAGLGVAAVTLAFKQLNAEAAHFEQRLQGVNLAAGAKAYRDTYRAALYEATGRGEWFARTKTGVQNWASKAWTSLMMVGTAGDRGDAEGLAQRAKELASERVDIQREMDRLVVHQAELQKEINSLGLVARDRSASAAERAAAEARMRELVNEKYDRQVALAERLRDNLTEMNSLTDSTDAELREQYAAEAAVLNLEGQRNQELTSLVRLSNQIGAAAGAQAKSARETLEATVLTLEAAREQVALEMRAAEIKKGNDALLLQAKREARGFEGVAAVTGSGLTAGAYVQIPATIVPRVDVEAAERAVVELGGIVESGIARMSQSIGELIGDLVNGEGAWGNFASAAVGAIADMVSMVGQAFIKTGVGVEAAKLALESGNGYAAIAAGAAMVAIAAAMKVTMGNAAANWGAGASVPVASSSYAAGNATQSSFGRQLEVKVTGTLTADGSKLRAILNNDDNRMNYTT